MLYYNMLMAERDHHHDHSHHHPGHAHPPAALHVSLLRMSAAQRLGFAVAVMALLWAVAFWAMR